PAATVRPMSIPRMAQRGRYLMFRISSLLSWENICCMACCNRSVILLTLKGNCFQKFCQGSGNTTFLGGPQVRTRGQAQTPGKSFFTGPVSIEGCIFEDRLKM